MPKHLQPHSINHILEKVDEVPTTVKDPTGKAKLILLEENEAVIKMTLKGRSPNMRHVPRTHKVDLDWLFERVKNDPGFNIFYVHTKLQVADILTKGNFTVEAFSRLCELANILDNTFSRIPSTHGKLGSSLDGRPQNTKRESPRNISAHAAPTTVAVRRPWASTAKKLPLLLLASCLRQTTTNLMCRHLIV